MDKEKLAEAAASWWIDRIQSPTKDNGNLLQSSFGTLLSRKRKEIPAEVLNTLHTNIKAKLLHMLTYYTRAYLKTDYAPQYELRQVVEASGLDPENGLIFPWKSSTDIKDGKLFVCNGSSSPVELILDTCKD